MCVEKLNLLSKSTGAKDKRFVTVYKNKAATKPIDLLTLKPATEQKIAAFLNSHPKPSPSKPKAKEASSAPVAIDAKQAPFKPADFKARTLSTSGPVFPPPLRCSLRSKLQPRQRSSFQSKCTPTSQ
jgi:hypothetical protein